MEGNQEKQGKEHLSFKGPLLKSKGNEIKADDTKGKFDGEK
jgi:hypothetical protein